MKQHLYKKRSRWLLCTLLTTLLALGSATKAWAQVTESFEDVTTVNADTWGRAGSLSNGWVCTSSVGIGSSTDYSYSIWSKAKTGSNSLAGKASSSNSDYIVIPVEITGDITFSMCCLSSSSSTTGYVKFYKATDNGDGTYSIGTQIGSNFTKSGSSSYSWVDKTLTVGDDETMIAICMYRAAIDDLTYTPFVSSGCVKPKSPIVTGITDASAAIGWTSDGDTWNIRYKAEGDADYTAVNSVTENPYLLNGLVAGTNYTFQVQNVCGDIEMSDWSAEGTFTTALCEASAQKEITCTIWDTYGDGWNGNAALEVVDAATGTKVASFTVTSSDGKAEVEKTVGLCPNRIYNINWVKGSYDSECRFTVKDVDGNVFIDYSSTNPSSSTTLDTYQWINGPKMIVSETSIAFGTITSESIAADKVKIFTISNTGNATLEGITVSYTGDDVFSVSPSLSDQTIAVDGDAITVTLTMDASAAGSFSGTVSVAAVGQPTVEIPVSGSFAAAAATMAVSLGDAAVEETVTFGEIGKQATKTFTVTNDGNLKLNISIASDNTTDFTVSPSALVVAGGSSETFIVTFVYGEDPVLDAEKTANITITPSNEGLSPKTFEVTGTRIEQWSEDFSGNVIPNGWESTSTTYWTFSDGVAHASYNYSAAYLTTPSLKVEATTDALTFDYIATGNYVSIAIQKSKNGGSWETCSTATAIGTLNTGNSGTATITGLEPGNYKFRFKSDDYNLDNFAGLKLNDNDPRMGIYTDAECTVAATTAVSNDFGFVTEAQTATYYIKNDGTGTMTLALGDEPAGFTQSLDKTSVAAGEKATLTITMPVANKGYHAGNVVVTATDLGTFTASLTGVMVDENKLNLDFATANIPTTWTANSWEKNAGGYYRAGYSSTTMETSQLTAEAGEEIVIVAKNEYTGSYTFGVNYKKVDAEEWSTLIAAANLGTSWTTLHASIAEAGDYLIQFVGSYAQIKHIYGLTEPNEPVMVVYDGEATAAATYSFGSVANDADAVKTFTVKNEGKALLAGLTAALSGDQADNYSVAISGLTEGGVAAGETATITVTQKKDNLGSHAATLTISSTSEGIAPFVIALSGTTRDASKLYVDFADGIPANWTATSWSATSGYAQSAYSGTCTLQTPALTVAAGEELSFDLSKQYNNNSAQLAVRYTLDGGVTWTTQDLSSNLTYNSFTTKTLSLGNETEVTAVIQFVGTYYARLDNFFGGVATTAPMISVTESGTAITNGAEKDFGTVSQTMGDQTATYVITNNGNADMVSTVTTTSAVYATLSTTEAEGVTIDGNKVTLAAGKTATITVTLPFTTPYGDQTGTMTITTEGWVGTLTQNFKASLVDPTALYVDFSDNSKPAGWYNAGWTFSNGYAETSYTTYEMITEQFEADAEKNTLSFEAKSTTSYSTPELTVYTSTDRKNWSEGKTIELTSAFQTFNLDPLAAGKYYVKFVGKYAAVDNIAGLKTVEAPAHDLYVTTATLPTATVVPGTSYTASVKVASLRAAETVAAELYFGETRVAELTEQEIALNATGNFELTGNVPVEEGNYDVYIKVYNSDVAVETEKVSVEVAHTRTLAVQSFTTEDTALQANSNNEITVNFSATVKNTGTVALTAEQVSLTLMQGETEVVTATAAEALDINGETVITLTKTISAGEGGTQTFAVRENLGNTVFATTRDITVTASAPKFELAVKDGAAVANGDAVDFGLVKAATTKTYTITNSGTAALELISIEASEGFEATAVTDENKTIATDGTLDIDVTLKAEQGKKNGTLVFTYKVDESTNGTFTLNLSGRSVSEDIWTETFDTEIPASWVNGGWTWNDENHSAYSTYSLGYELMTPRLAATEGEELTFDVNFRYSGYSLTAQYSSDRTTWNDIATYTESGEQTFIAPATGNYYIKFSAGRYVELDNFVGFKLNIPEHDTEISDYSVPATAKQFNTYTATVTLKESAGKAEELTAELYVDGEVMATETETITANGRTVITLTWEPQTVIAEAVKAYIKVSGTGIDLATEEIDFTVAEVYTLDETSTETTLDAISGETVQLKRAFNAGWNTVCLPFDISDIEAFFGADAKAYQLTGFTEGVFNFSRVTTLSASYPYVVYVPAAIEEPKLIRDVTISSTNNTAFHNNFTDYSSEDRKLYFRGTYAAVAAGEWTKAADGDVIYGVTSDGYLRPAGASASIKGFRAYFDLGAAIAAGVKGISFDGEEILTGLRSIFSDAEDGQQIYDINGRRVNRASQKGVYIVDGEKVMVK